MSRISDVSNRLGQFMLTGWVLTDEGCAICSIPMLRSPAGQSPVQMFCAQCYSSPDAALSSAPARAVRHEMPQPSTASTSSAGFSRVSTPPTEVSSTLSSPTFAPPPGDPQETLRRRAQSDLASAEIGRRMLQGWAMLAEECPNGSCYGVPLVRPPKPGISKDPRKECVVCGNVYVFEKDSHGLDGLVRFNPPETLSVPQAIKTPVSRLDPPSDPDAPDIHPHGTMQNASMPQPTSPTENSRPVTHQTTLLQSLTPTISALDASITSLNGALVVLANRLTVLSGRDPLNPISIGEVATSIEKTATALRAAKLLRYDESSLLTP